MEFADGASLIAYTLRFREPVGASPGHKLRSNIARDAARGQHLRFKASAFERKRRVLKSLASVDYHTRTHAS